MHEGGLRRGFWSSTVAKGDENGEMTPERGMVFCVRSATLGLGSG